MSIRARQFIALREEVLGPRGNNAAYEENDNPKSSYVTGVLAPHGLRQPMPASLGKIDISGSRPFKSAEEENDDNVSDFDISTKLLHPLALPKSIGISFVLEDGKTGLDFCVSFAKYRKENNTHKREPCIFIERGVDASKNTTWNTSHGNVMIKLVSRRMADDNHHVSLFLVNKSNVKENAKDPDYVFQPQIRINLTDDTALRPVRNLRTRSDDNTEDEGDDEEARLDFLYRDYKALARGHMTGAVWQKIDPERPSKDGCLPLPPDMSERVFADNEYSREDMEYFVNPHLRTDFLPSYSVNNDMIGLSSIGLDEDDMDAEVLAGGFDSPKLFDSLDRLAGAYKDWIEKQDISGLSGNERKIAQGNLDGCRDAHRRIMSGIELLRDDKARLAFCFLNKAMAVQAGWAGRPRLVWRPFQLAFILQCLEGIARPDSPDRKICDLLWYPTGGGKTEAYLGMLIFAMALRRLRRAPGSSACYGTAAMSRYTLRLLTLQQFRRALSAVTACELLRCRDWNPSGMRIGDEPLWGTVSFSAGLWVGGGLTPNEMADRVGKHQTSYKPVTYAGAASILTYNHLITPPGHEKTRYEGDPAQVLKCPCCGCSLSVPERGASDSRHEILLTIRCKNTPEFSPDDLVYGDITEIKYETSSLPNGDYHVLKLSFKTGSSDRVDRKINSWWKNHIMKKVPGMRLECAAASRPGYFLKFGASADDPYGDGSAYDTEIRCPNPGCELNGEQWSEFVYTPDKKPVPAEVLEPFRNNNTGASRGIPIPAFCVDSQIYSKCPSLLVATVDKFAQLPMRVETASMFGNIDAVDGRMGFCRSGAMPDSERPSLELLPMPPFHPPDIIIQDELHLIDGPLGSMVGLYETAIDILSTRHDNDSHVSPKYLVSTATIRAAGDQIKSLYCREFKEFPPPGITAGKNFFSDHTEAHPMDDDGPGRWYVGVMAPGRGPITPLTRIWASILQGSQTIRGDGEITGNLAYFWTVVGYFNAMRELAGIVSAYRQDIPGYVKIIASRTKGRPRDIEQRQPVELHSNIQDKSNISAIFERLEKERMDAVLATSMFGTGVDVDKLSQMIVAGQPKTTAGYIQATGRVGRKKGALVVTFLRSTRPRDLDHYEFFTGYHRALHRHVEPLTVFPFSPGAVGKGLLPVMVAILRNGRRIDDVRIHDGWAPEDWRKAKPSGCRRMADHRQDAEVVAIMNKITDRNEGQPKDRIDLDGNVARTLKSLVSRWEINAKNKNLYYHETAYGRGPKRDVVLGDEKHREAGFSSVNENTPNSLRDVESNMQFKDAESNRRFRG